MTEHKFKLDHKFKPPNRAVEVDVFKCEHCPAEIRGERYTFPVEPTSPLFKVDWEWNVYLKAKDARETTCEKEDPEKKSPNEGRD